MSKKPNWYTNPRKYHFIYKTTCQVNRKYYYGMHLTDNLEDGYVGSGTRLWHAIKKYGRENFKLEILEFCTDRESLKQREAELITEEMLQDPMCMNLSLGGGEIKLTREQYQARNKKCKRRFLEKMKDPEYHSYFCQRLKDTNSHHRNGGGKTIGMTGKVHSSETKSLMAKKKQGMNNPSFGTCWITNSDTTIKIKLIELDHYVAQGWKRGRKRVSCGDSLMLA